MDPHSNITSIDELSAEKLFQMAEEKNEEMNDEEAEFFYSKAYAKSPENDMIVLCYAEFLKSSNNYQLSKQILIKSLQERPNGSYKRYFQLAELYEGEEAIKIFEEGIKKALETNPNAMSLFSSEKDKVSNKEIARDVANAYAAIAEVCMSDLINYKEAEAKCVESLQQGEKHDPLCLDVQLQQANYLLFKDNETQARNKLLGIHSHLTSQPQDYSQQLKEQTSKLLIEVECFKQAIDILNNLNEVTGKDLEIVYFLAYAYYQIKMYSRCVEHLEECEELVKESMDEELVEATQDLRREINKLDPKLLEEEEPEETIEDDGDNDWMDVEEDDQ